ncbi:MAG: hypothetical protein H6698_02365 [Myxococcales bacterium]|nr:hypothetical protein [Myxococcales bacterium]MCB9519936.1 hypothetical protein [Myxococcales bacterium]MCB9533156.1 hypothetical protein [Myxococcales bacterium]
MNPPFCVKARVTVVTAAAAMLVACATGRGTSVEDDDVVVVDVGDVADEVADAGTDLGRDVSPDTEETSVDDVPDDAPEPDVVEDTGPPFPTVIVAVDTRLSATAVRAGQAVFASCDAIDADGQIVAIPEGVSVSYVIAPAAALEVVSGNELRALQAGNASVSCAIPSLSLIDDTPADLAIRPGAPYTVLTETDRVALTAGEQVQVTCTAYDEQGNYIPDAELEVLVDPFGDGVEVFDDRVIIERAGLYEITCSADGAPDLISELIEVAPGLPAALAVGITPDRGIYTIGDVVSLTWTVTDEYGNLVENPPVQFSSVPTVPTFGAGRFRFDAEGIIRLTVFVARPTATGSPLVGSIEVIVNGVGPTIDCEFPAYGAMINGPPGAPVLIEGTVGDEFGVAQVRVNGIEAYIRPDNTFIAEVPSTLGGNFVRVEAFDELGASSSRTCAFLMGDQWTPEGTFLDDDIAMTLTQEAFDDRNRSDGLDSLDDLIHTILNSSQLRTQIDSALRAADPLYPTTCVLDSWFGCIVSVGVNYQYFELSGPNDASLTLVDGGLRTSVNVRGIRVGLRVRGTLSSSGSVSLSNLGLTMTFDVGLAGGRPRLALRSLDAVDVGGIDSSFSGLTGFIIDIVVSLFEGTIRDLIRDQIRDFVQNEISAVLDDTLSGLDISSLGANFDVPRLDGGAPIPVGFGIRFSRITVDPSRAIFGIGSRFTAPIAHGGATLGALQPPGAILDDRRPDRSVRVAVNLALLNQVLHTLWRGGLFDATVGGDSLGGVPSDAQAILYANLPPVAVGRTGNDIDLHFGGLRAQVTYPSILAEPITVHLGAKVRTGIDLIGDSELDFRDIRLTEFYFDPISTEIDASTRATLESFLQSTIQSVLDSSLDDALPNFPIPAFELPSSVTEFGLPAGAYLGLLEPILTVDERHLVLQGNFGTR